jgi:hypothetical protein
MNTYEFYFIPMVLFICDFIESLIPLLSISIEPGNVTHHCDLPFLEGTGWKEVPGPPAISSCALFDSNSDSTWDN